MEARLHVQFESAPGRDADAVDSGDSGASSAASALMDAIRRGEEMPRFSSIQLQVLQRALADQPHASDSFTPSEETISVHLGDDLLAV